MGFKRFKSKQRTLTKAYDIHSSTKLANLGQWGNSDYGIRIVRLISKDPLHAQAAALAIKLAAGFAEQLNAQLLITPGGFGVATSQYPYQEKEAMQAMAEYMAEFFRIIPAKRAFDIILGIDTEDGKLQDAYFIPRNNHLTTECIRVWKSYPRQDEAGFVITKGRPCPNRMVKVGESRISILVCHDLAPFAKRSQVNRGVSRERWAKQLDSEIARGANTGVVHLIHYLDKSSQGMIFTSGMEALIAGGINWGISAFKTTLDITSDLSELREIEERTARFAGETLDFYVS